MRKGILVSRQFISLVESGQRAPLHPLAQRWADLLEHWLLPADKEAILDASVATLRECQRYGQPVQRGSRRPTWGELQAPIRFREFKAEAARVMREEERRVIREAQFQQQWGWHPGARLWRQVQRGG